MDLALTSAARIHGLLRKSRRKTGDAKTRQRTQETGDGRRETGRKLQASSFKTQDTGRKTQDTRHKTQGTRPKIEDGGPDESSKPQAALITFYESRFTHHVSGTERTTHDRRAWPHASSA